MKNLTSKHITVQRSDGSRFSIPPSAEVPTLVLRPAFLIGCLNDVAIYAERTHRVDFGNIVLNPDDYPCIVDLDIFNALPADAITFITPDVGESAIKNAFNGVQAVTRFVAKRAAVDARVVSNTLPQEPVLSS